MCIIYYIASITFMALQYILPIMIVFILKMDFIIETCC